MPHDKDTATRGRLAALTAMLHQYRTHAATLCHVLGIDHRAPKGEVLPEMVRRIRDLQNAAATNPPRIVYVSTKKPPKTRH